MKVGNGGSHKYNTVDQLRVLEIGHRFPAAEELLAGQDIALPQRRRQDCGYHRHRSGLTVVTFGLSSLYGGETGYKRRMLRLHSAAGSPESGEAARAEDAAGIMNKKKIRIVGKPCAHPQTAWA